MRSVSYCWNDEDGGHAVELVHVRGTHSEPYAFGEPPNDLLVDVPDFFIATVPVTQRLWTHLSGAVPPAIRSGACRRGNRELRLPGTAGGGRQGSGGGSLVRLLLRVGAALEPPLGEREPDEAPILLTDGPAGQRSSEVLQPIPLAARRDAAVDEAPGADMVSPWWPIAPARLHRGRTVSVPQEVGRRADVDHRRR